MNHTILLVEDEDSIRDIYQRQLAKAGFIVTAVKNGTESLEMLRVQQFDLMILDIMLPEIDGIRVLESLRLQNNTMPVLILSAKNNSADKVLGLKKGADDYLTKPFNLEELLLRVHKLIEKNKQLQDKETVSNEYNFDKNAIDFKALVAINYKGEKIELSKKEAMLLKLLIENKNEVVTREKILQAVWGYNVYPTTRTIDNFILSFRKYFEEDSRNPRYFHSVRGMGYKFTD